MNKSFKIGYSHGVNGRKRQYPFRWYWSQRWYDYGYSLGYRKAIAH